MIQQTIMKSLLHLERLENYNEKKDALVIVEGPSDGEALGAVLNNYFDKDRVYVHTHHGDITTEKGNKCSNIISKVNECVKQCMRQYPFKRSDFKRIIHVVDMDGAFILTMQL